MENTPRLYNTLVDALSQHRNWLDRRHLKTLTWMMVGLILSGTISLPEWVSRFGRSGSGGGALCAER